jgi:predicted membrane channel-forming protein YqfA (hemolysin III family)
MWLLRYLLIAASIVPAVIVIFMMKSESRSLNATEIMWGFGIAIVLFVNAYYLVEHPPFANRPYGRLGRFISLWLQAKENEMEKRAAKDQSGTLTT